MKECIKNYLHCAWICLDSFCLYTADLKGLGIIWLMSWFGLMTFCNNWSLRRFNVFRAFFFFFLKNHSVAKLGLKERSWRAKFLLCFFSKSCNLPSSCECQSPCHSSLAHVWLDAHNELFSGRCATECDPAGFSMISFQNGRCPC